MSNKEDIMSKVPLKRQEGFRRIPMVNTYENPPLEEQNENSNVVAEDTEENPVLRRTEANRNLISLKEKEGETISKQDEPIIADLADEDAVSEYGEGEEEEVEPVKDDSDLELGGGKQRKTKRRKSTKKHKSRKHKSRKHKSRKSAKKSKRRKSAKKSKRKYI